MGTHKNKVSFFGCGWYLNNHLVYNPLEPAQSDKKE